MKILFALALIFIFTGIFIIPTLDRIANALEKIAGQVQVPKAEEKKP